LTTDQALPSPPLYALDTPKRQTLDAGVVFFEGWLFHPHLKIETLTLHAGDQQVACALGGDRPDVGMQFGDKPQARRCGFSARLSLRAGTRPLWLEARYENGQCWRSQPMTTLSVKGWPRLRRWLGTVGAWTWRSRKAPMELIPGPEVTKTENGYLSAGEDPYFLLKGEYPTGWTAVHYRTTTPAFVRVRLYHDTGHGFNEFQAAPLLGEPRGDDRGVAWIPPGVQALRFDVGSMPGRFTLDDLVFREIGRIQLFWRGLAPILAKAPIQPARTLRRLAGIAVRLALGARQEVLEELLATQGNAYSEWAALYDTINDATRETIREDVARMRRRPKISVIMPVYNTPERFLREAIDSVVDQLYPDWELCIADDASPKARTREVLAEYAARDPRIKTVFRPVGGHISEASNSALELATGDFVAFLDHDDLIPEHALYRMAKELERYPEARLVYSDEDKIDANGVRHTPYFKSSWNPDLLMAQNYVCHLAVYEAALVRKVGGLRKGFEGSQDHDLVLRCSDFLQEGQIRHVPQVLYHWRELPGSTALAADSKPYAKQAGQRAIEEALRRKGRKARVEAAGYYQVQYALPEPLPLVSLIIPTRNGLELTRACLKSIDHRTDYDRLDIIIVDNQSDDPETLAWFREIDRRADVRVLRYNKPFNFSGINNFAVDHARGEVIGLINNDIQAFEPQWLREMTSHALRPNVGAVGAKLFYPDGHVQHAGVALGVGGVAGHVFKRFRRDHQGYFGRLHLAHNVSAVTAACLLTRQSIWREVGGMNERDLAVAFNDVDYCLRLRERGYRIVMNPRARLYHHESVTRGSDFAPEKRERFQRESDYMHQRWGALLQNDPYYNPNLTLEKEDYSLSWKPRASPLFTTRPPLEPAPQKSEKRPAKVG